MDLIEVRTVEYDGLDYVVELRADYGITPMEYDCYSVDDIDAWRRDEWRYVDVRVYLHGLAEASSAWLGGVEYGSLGEITCDLDSIVRDVVPDMLAESQALARDSIAQWARTLLTVA